VTTRLVAVSAGDSPTSKTRALARAALELRGEGELIDLSTLSAPGLLGRERDSGVSEAVDKASSAEVLVVATPVYRATYSGALKAFFDRFAPDALTGTAVVLAATAAITEHFLSLDTGLRPLVASLAGWSVPTVVYATSDDFAEGKPAPHIVSLMATALAQADHIASVVRSTRA
jgi:FMN reductase